MPNPIKFGTDGWRAIIAQEFTFDNVRICAQGVADYLKRAKLDGRGLIIGYDTRFASEDFAAAAAEVVAANGIKVYLTSKATPTPVVSYGVLAEKAGGAIIITASHNPRQWNGFKFKTEDGSSAPDEVTAQIVAFIEQAAASSPRHFGLAEAVKKGQVEYVDLSPVYTEQLKRLVDIEKLRQSHLRIVIDPMYGTGAGYLKSMLEGSNLKITELNSQRNPIFPGMERPEPIAVNLIKLSSTIKRLKANVGLAMDGDADRMGIIDEKGNFLTQLQVYALLCLYLLEVRGERGAIVKTITTTSMAYRLAELYKVPIFETGVGFKNVAPVMLAQNAMFGGEESGGYGFRGHVRERDGILANLYFLDFVVRTGKTPSQLLEYLYSKVGPHYYERADATFPEEQRQAIIARIRDHAPQSIDGVKVARVDTFDGFRFVLDDNSWLLIRFSGTEPVIRIYSETDSTARARHLLEQGKKLAGI